MNSSWITDRNPPDHGYYIAAWDDQGETRVSELWFNPDSIGSGWWASRGYMRKHEGDAFGWARKPITVLAWMNFPEYPGPGRIIAYKHNDQIFDPEDMIIIRG